MDRDAGSSDRSDELRQDDARTLGDESEEPGRETSPTDHDVTAGTDQPGGTVSMSEGDPMRTRLGSHVEDAGTAGHEGEPAGAGYEAAPAAAYEEEPGSAGVVGDETAPAGVGVAGSAYEAAPAGYEGEPGGAGMVGDQGAPGREVPAAYTGEEADVTGRPEYADRAEGGDQALYEQEPQRADRAGGDTSLFASEEPDRLDRPGPQEPGVQEGVYDQEADQARRPRPSDGS
jgi:hypothetical protein